MKRLFFVFALLTLSLTAAPTNKEQLRALSKGFASIAKEAAPSVVSIRVEGMTAEEPDEPLGPDSMHDELFRRFFGGPGPGMRRRSVPTIGQGSGFIVSNEGYILTNNHIIRKPKKITVYLTDGREFDATVVGTDPQTDLAIIKIDARNLTPLKLGNSDELEVGEWAIAIGSPFGLEETVTVGVISAKGRNQLHINDFEDFLQTDAAINPGNSGGPLLNLDGEVIGINSALATGTGGYMGIGFAIPSNMAQRVMDQLISNGSVTRGYIGIVMQPIDKDLADSFDLEKPKGVLIAEVLPDSPAAKAGLEQGDVIVAFNGQPVESMAALRNSISLLEPGSKIRLKLIRSGKAINKAVEIAKYPKAGGEPGTPAHSLGIEVEPLTEQTASQLGYRGEEGVLVKKVAPGTPAALVGLRPGALILRVNRKATPTVESFQEALEETQESKKVLLLVKQGEATRFVSLKW
ncbi:MAG: DegQ family serine endoprotease [Parachlamydiales bacterium]